MKIRILLAGTFSKFIRPNKVSTQQLAVGDIVDYPDWYAGCMVKMKRAENYVEAPTLAFEETYQATPASETTVIQSNTVHIEIDATDAAFKLAGELGVDLLTLIGSGAGGRITVRDVRKAAG